MFKDIQAQTDTPSHELVLVKSHEFEGKTKAATSVVTISESFGKDHRKVLKIANNLIDQGFFNAANFSRISYTDNVGREQETLILDDQFTSFVITSFTGKKAQVWKKKFIDAFFAMKEKLEQLAKAPKEPTKEQIRAEGKKIRNGVTTTWGDHGVQDGMHFGVLTNAVYQNVLGGKAAELKADKGLKPADSLRDHMSKDELISVSIAETNVKLLTEKAKPDGFKENLRCTTNAALIAKDMVKLRDAKFKELLEGKE